ncbi:hypothetical protein D1013_09800 [Euzebyella marina]|uniref:Uncharacterized protein n=2 Tax=Euzebyella marina TaxID=1761453 RepID=A0A3G2L5W5_9FLAO|nr:hypothetical protein D1013_09800 [Euzebyella marina]
MSIDFQVSKKGRSMVQINGASFRLDSNIIKCSIENHFDLSFLEEGFSEGFSERIKFLSKGKYLPLLIDLREVPKRELINLFKILSPYKLNDIGMHRPTFLVQSFLMRMYLMVYCILKGNAFFNHIFNSSVKAENYCMRMSETINPTEI